MYRNKVEQFLKHFNRKNRCNLVLGEYINFGLTGMVFSVRENPTFLCPQKYEEQDMVLKIMQTHIVYKKVFESNGKLNAQVQELKQEERGYYEDLHRQEIELMEQFADCDYVMPLLDSTVICEDERLHKYVFLLLMPKLRPLNEQLCDLDKIQERELIKIGTDISRALSVLHANKILHRDVKAANVYLREDERGNRHYLLGDLGCCRSFVKDPYNPVTRVSNPDTDDPALLRGEIKPNTYILDVYQLGRMLQKMAEENRSRGMTLGPHFQKILSTATEMRIDRRYRDGGALLRALRSLTGAERSSKTEILLNKDRHRAKMAIQRGDFEEALEITENAQSGCDVLWRYCRSHMALEALSNGGHISEIMELVDELEDAGLEAKIDAERPQYQCLCAMLARAIGDIDKFALNMQSAASDHFVPAMYYYGLFVYNRELAAEAPREEGLAYLHEAAMMGCDEALAFYLELPREDWPEDLKDAIMQLEYEKSLRKRRENLFVKYL